MSPSEISAELKHRERFVGTHFWNPGHLIPLVEVVKSDASSDEVAQTVMEVLRSVARSPCCAKRTCPASSPTACSTPCGVSHLHRGERHRRRRTVDEAVRYSFGLRLPQLGPWRTPTWWVPT